MVESTITADRSYSLADKLGINLEATVNGVLASDEASSVDLNNYLDRLLWRTFSTLADGSDLRQEAKIRIFSKLSKFDPNHIEGMGFDKSFARWAGVVGRNHKYDYFRRKKREGIREHNNLQLYEIEDKNLSENKANPDLQMNEEVRNSLIVKTDQILRDSEGKGASPLAREIVCLSIGGYKIDEIAKEVDRSVPRVKAYLSYSRKILEEQLLFPAKYRRLNEFAENDTVYNAMHRAIKSKKILAIKYLNIYYVSCEDADKFFKKRLANQA